MVSGLGEDAVLINVGNKKDDDGRRRREGLVPRLRVIFRRLVSTGVAQSRLLLVF